ncbi:MAG: hypothetical protein NTU55_00290 [Actinobacteria bacterium]|nr:hypothetical protein [Actinomycetota bacterium]
MLKRVSRLLLPVTLLFSLLITANPAFAETASSAGSSNNSLEFGSASSTLTLSPGINFGTSAFTFETYFKTGPVIDNGFFLGVGDGTGLSINIHSVTEIQIDGFCINATVFVLPTAMQVNTWHHLAIARDASNNETVWLDGVRAASGYNRWNNSLTYGPVFTDDRNYNGPTTGINKSDACGHCNGPGDRDFNGVKITNFRVVVGSSIYDPNSPTITLPTTPLANVANTKLLLNVSNSSAFLTDSSGNQTITNSSVVFRAADTTAPAAPTSLVATAGDGQASISFTQGSNGGSAISNYKYSLDGTTYTALSPTATTSPITISGLTNATSYSIYLKAVNAVGDSSASSSVSVTPVATNTGGGASSSSQGEVIPNVTTANSRNRKIISWDQPTDLVLTTYNKTTKKTKVSTLSGGEVSVTNPKPGQTATYTISSAKGEVLKAFTVKSKPESPKKVEAVIQASTLSASWSKSVGAKKYRVTITPEIGKPITLTTTDPNISIDLESAGKATLKVVAIGANGLVSKTVLKTI